MTTMNEIDVEKCLAKDFGKYKYNFFEKYEKLDIEHCEKIYGNSGLPDPDAFSEILYDFYAELWKYQKEKLKLNVPEVENKWKGSYWELIGVNNNQFRLGTDSIMSIYWHRFDMREFIKKLIKENFRNFIKEYLLKSNKIGGYIVFPRHIQSINQQRGTCSKVNDRFDLTLECIRRYYVEKENDNPLFSVLNKDEKFFNMFGEDKEGFEKYTEFFCLNESYDDKQNWVNEKGQVLNLFDNQPLDDWNFNRDNPLPDKNNWWIFYHNIMSRLDARNQQIKELIKGEK